MTRSRRTAKLGPLCTRCGGLLPVSEARAGFTTHERCVLPLLAESGRDDPDTNDGIEFARGDD